MKKIILSLGLLFSVNCFAANDMSMTVLHNSYVGPLKVSYVKCEYKSNWFSCDSDINVVQIEPDQYISLPIVDGFFIKVLNYRLPNDLHTYYFYCDDYKQTTKGHPMRTILDIGTDVTIFGPSLICRENYMRPSEDK